MKVAERMRRDGWRMDNRVGAWCRCEAGYTLCVFPNLSRFAEISGWYRNGPWRFTAFVPPLAVDATMYGVFDLAQRAKAAARKLARKRRTR